MEINQQNNNNNISNTHQYATIVNSYKIKR